MGAGFSYADVKEMTLKEVRECFAYTQRIAAENLRHAAAAVQIGAAAAFGSKDAARWISDGDRN